MKTFTVEIVEVRGRKTVKMKWVTCPNCGEKILVSRRWPGQMRFDGKLYKTRSCQWCFKTARVP